MLQGFVNHVLSEFENSEESPKGLFFIDAAVMWALGMTMYI